MITVSNQKTPCPFSNIPNDVIGSKIFSFLLDVDHPKSIATLNQVCKQWNSILSTDLPFTVCMENANFFEKYPRMAIHRIQAQSYRELYLGYFPKSLIEKIQLAYETTQLNTSDFEATNLIPILISNPWVISALESVGCSNLLPISIAMSWLPGTLPFRGEPNEAAGQMFMGGVCSFSGATIISVIISNPKNFFLREQPFSEVHYDLTDVILPLFLGIWAIQIAVHRLLNYDDGSLMARSYRLLKGGIATLNPICKVARARIGNFASYILRQLHNPTTKKSFQRLSPPAKFFTDSQFFKLVKICLQIIRFL